MSRAGKHVCPERNMCPEKPLSERNCSSVSHPVLALRANTAPVLARFLILELIHEMPRALMAVLAVVLMSP